MTSQDIADAAAAGAWSVLCGHMEPRRADDALIVSGSGKVGYDGDGVLGVTLIVDVEIASVRHRKTPFVGRRGAFGT